MMEYKGYLAEVAFDEEAQILHGEVVNTGDVITFQANGIAALEEEFHKSVDVYLEFCPQADRAGAETPEGQSLFSQGIQELTRYSSRRVAGTKQRRRYGAKHATTKTPVNALQWIHSA